LLARENDTPRHFAKLIGATLDDVLKMMKMSDNLRFKKGTKVFLPTAAAVDYKRRADEATAQAVVKTAAAEAAAAEAAAAEAAAAEAAAAEAAAAEAAAAEAGRGEEDATDGVRLASIKQRLQAADAALQAERE
jgi:hypothetical protein